MANVLWLYLAPFSMVPDLFKIRESAIDEKGKTDAKKKEIQT